MSRARPHVVLVHSRVGGGHLSAARALAEQLESTGRATTTLVDAYLDCGRFPVSRFPALYAHLARHHPRVWSMLYYGSTRLEPTSTLGVFLSAGLRRVIQRERPDLVVSVLPVVNGLLARAAAAHGVRVEVVLTDWHAVHPLWVAAGVDYYTTPTDSARLDCVSFGAPPNRVAVVGIPVRRTFAEAAGRWPPPAGSGQRFTILAMVGAEGSPRALRNIARLAQLELDARLLVLCGRNAHLRQHVQRLPARMPVEALGFVDNVAELMRGADMLVTKAGGLTLAEAFCCRVPVVVHDVLPGQEAGNLEYVLQHSAALYAGEPETLANVVAELYADPGRRQALAQRGAVLARPDAARRIAADLLQRLDA